LGLCFLVAGGSLALFCRRSNSVLVLCQEKQRVRASELNQHNMR
jgi:hypothetical protein